MIRKKDEAIEVNYVFIKTSSLQSYEGYDTNLPECKR